MTKRVIKTKPSAKARTLATGPRLPRRERLIGSEALQPAAIVGGALAQEGERTLLLVGGLSLEVLSDPALPATPSRLAEARRRTRDTFATLIGQHVLLRTRQIGGMLVFARALQIPGAAPPSSQDAVFASINDIIARRSHELLGLPGVLAVRPGYRFRNGWISNEPCIVARAKYPMLISRQLPEFPNGSTALQSMSLQPAPSSRFLQVAKAPDSCQKILPTLLATRCPELSLQHMRPSAPN